jgi:hypothetical protein
MVTLERIYVKLERWWKDATNINLESYSFGEKCIFSELGLKRTSFNLPGIFYMIEKIVEFDDKCLARVINISS